MKDTDFEDHFITENIVITMFKILYALLVSFIELFVCKSIHKQCKRENVLGPEIY